MFIFIKYAVLLAFYVCSLKSFTFRRQHQISFKNEVKLSMRSGGHGDGFKFIPIHQAKQLENFPRIVPIAGVYPDITPQDLLAPSPTLPVRKGSWTYDFSTPDGPQLGTVALPPSDQMTACVDPVAVISTNVALGIKNLAFDVEVVLVIDRGNTAFKAETFYALKSPTNEVVIRWSDQMLPGYEIIGKVVMCTVPWVEGMRSKKSGFIEDDEDDTE